MGDAVRRAQNLFNPLNMNIKKQKKNRYHLDTWVNNKLKIFFAFFSKCNFYHLLINIKPVYFFKLKILNPFFKGFKSDPNS